MEGICTIGWIGGRAGSWRWMIALVVTAAVSVFVFGCCNRHGLTTGKFGRGNKRNRNGMEGKGREEYTERNGEAKWILFNNWVVYIVA